MQSDYLYIAIIGVLLLVIAVFQVKKWYKRFSLRQRFKYAEGKERDAAQFLENKGFQIVSSQEPFSYELEENGEPVTISVVTDYIVKKDGYTYIVEVKTGNTAPSIRSSSTRRQILEYTLFIPNDGVFLLDMENKELKKIDFPFGEEASVSSNKNKVIFFLVVVVLGLAFWCWYLK